MKFRLSVFIAPFIILLLIKTASAQEISNAPLTSDRYLGNNTSNYRDVSGKNFVKEKTPQQETLERQILNLKKRKQTRKQNRN